MKKFIVVRNDEVQATYDSVEAARVFAENEASGYAPDKVHVFQHIGTVGVPCVPQWDTSMKEAPFLACRSND